MRVLGVVKLGDKTTRELEEVEVEALEVDVGKARVETAEVEDFLEVVLAIGLDVGVSCDAKALTGGVGFELVVARDMASEVDRLISETALEVGTALEL